MLMLMVMAVVVLVVNGLVTGFLQRMAFTTKQDLRAQKRRPSRFSESRVHSSSSFPAVH